MARTVVVARLYGSCAADLAGNGGGRSYGIFTVYRQSALFVPGSAEGGLACIHQSVPAREGGQYHDPEELPVYFVQRRAMGELAGSHSDSMI